MAEDNIFREVDEELRSERMRTLWRRLAPFVIGAAVAVVALVAVNEGWSWYSNSQAAGSSDQLYAAINSGDDLAAAQTRLDQLVASGSGGYPVLAEFRKASLLAEAGDAAGAVAAYDALANSQSNIRLRELALLQAAQVLVDSGTLADVEARIGTLASDDNPMRRVARELIGLAQYKAGDSAAAQASFEAVLNDPLAQGQIRNRMAYYLAQMLSEGSVAAEPDASIPATADDAAPSAQ